MVSDRTKGWKLTSFEIPNEINASGKEIRAFIYHTVEIFSKFKGTKESDKYMDNNPIFEKIYAELEKKEVMGKLKERIENATTTIK